MKEYEVRVSTTIYATVRVFAEDEQDAYERAEFDIYPEEYCGDTFGFEFTEDGEAGNMEIICTSYDAIRVDDVTEA